MKFINKYKKAYGKKIEEEMIWDMALRYQDVETRWKILNFDDANYWRADPFLVKHKNIIYLFYERYNRKKNIGEIAVSIVHTDLTLSKEECILSCAYHLSFPYIFEYDNQYYMIPETSSNQTIEVYKALDFPNKWVFYKTIIKNIKAVDTIVWDVNESGLILHTSITESNACNVENWLFWIDSNFNVIKKKKIKNTSDYGNRNAGKVIIKNEVKYRFGQDCRNGEYGKGLVLYVRKGEEEEEEVQYLGLTELGIVGSKYSGTHTYNTCDSIEVIDLRYLRKKSFSEKIKFILRLGGNYVRRRMHH